MQISSLSPNPAVGQTLHCSIELEQAHAAFHPPVEQQESSEPSVPESALQDSLSHAQALVDSWLEVQGDDDGFSWGAKCSPQCGRHSAH